MTINKMTLAAALSIGILASTVTINAATIDDISGLNLASCPLSGCEKRITPNNAKCPKCFQPKNNCKCQDPCEKPCEDPCEKPCEDPCEKSCDPCGAAPCDPCDPCEKSCEDPCNPCPAMAPCPCPDEPACAVCPNPENNSDLHRQQVYAYPYAIYGGNNVVGEYNNGIGLNASPYAPCPACADASYGCLNGLNAMTNGVPVISSCDPMPCGAAPTCDSCATGAALPIINNNSCGCGCGVPVEDNCKTSNGCGCPIQIHTQTSMEARKRSLEPFNMSMSQSTGGAASIPFVSSFSDIPQGFWAGCDINRLAENDVIVGYPDRTFKPNLPVSRAELASMVVKGFNLNDNMTCPQNTFRDVPRNHWGNKVINKAVANGLMCGYPNNTFKPNETVSRAEALTILSKGLKCDLSDCQAQEILSQYCDGNNVPGWAQIPVAKSLQAGVLNDSPLPKNIMPNNDASRADIASMLQSIRIAVGYDNQDKVSMDGCPCKPNDCDCQNSKAYIEKEEIVKVPTLKLCLNDELSAKHANIGDRFAARTVDAVTINGVNFPAGSIVHGKVTEVVRPTGKCKGAIKLSFNDIQNGKCKQKLPRQILTAQVNTLKKPNFFARLVEAPFTWTGGLIGNVGRTVGGAVVNAGNAVESVFDGVGVGTGEIFQGQFGSAGRSYTDAIKNTVKAPIDVTRTALSGTMGLFGYTADEVTYLVDPNGMKVSSVNPKQQVTISFGCPTQD